MPIPLAELPSPSSAYVHAFGAYTATITHLSNGDMTIALINGQFKWYSTFPFDSRMDKLVDRMRAQYPDEVPSAFVDATTVHRLKYRHCINIAETVAKIQEEHGVNACDYAIVTRVQDTSTYPRLVQYWACHLVGTKTRIFKHVEAVV